MIIEYAKNITSPLLLIYINTVTDLGLGGSSEMDGAQHAIAVLGFVRTDTPHNINNDGQTTSHPMLDIMLKLLSKKATPIMITDIAKNITSPLLLSFRRIYDIIANFVAL